MRKIIVTLMLLLFLAPSVVIAASPSPAPLTEDQQTKTQLCKGANLPGCAADPTVDSSVRLTDKIAKLTSTLLIVAGAIAVIIIIIAGIRYVTSTGDATRIKQAKDTLLYAVIGLIVVIASYAIVIFVNNNL